MSEKIKYLLISLVIASAFVLGNKALADEVATEDVTIEEATVVSSSSDNFAILSSSLLSSFSRVHIFFIFSLSLTYSLSERLRIFFIRPNTSISNRFKKDDRYCF